MVMMKKKINRASYDDNTLAYDEAQSGLQFTYIELLCVYYNRVSDASCRH